MKTQGGIEHMRDALKYCRDNTDDEIMKIVYQRQISILEWVLE